MTNVCTDNRENSIRDVMNIFNAMKIGETTLTSINVNVLTTLIVNVSVNYCCTMYI